MDDRASYAKWQRRTFAELERVPAKEVRISGYRDSAGLVWAEIVHLPTGRQFKWERPRSEGFHCNRWRHDTK